MARRCPPGARSPCGRATASPAAPAGSARAAISPWPAASPCRRRSAAGAPTGAARSAGWRAGRWRRATWSRSRRRPASRDPCWRCPLTASPATHTSGARGWCWGRRTTASPPTRSSPSSPRPTPSPGRPIAWVCAWTGRRSPSATAPPAPTSSPRGGDRRDPGAGGRPADRPPRRPPDDRRLRQDRARHRRRPLAVRAGATGRHRPLPRRPGRRGAGGVAPPPRRLRPGGPGPGPRR